jgi:hypothetical protein
MRRRAWDQRRYALFFFLRIRKAAKATPVPSRTHVPGSGTPGGGGSGIPSTAQFDPRHSPPVVSVGPPPRPLWNFAAIGENVTRLEERWPIVIETPEMSVLPAARPPDPPAQLPPVANAQTSTVNPGMFGLGNRFGLTLKTDPLTIEVRLVAEGSRPKPNDSSVAVPNVLLIGEIATLNDVGDHALIVNVATVEPQNTSKLVLPEMVIDVADADETPIVNTAAVATNQVTRRFMLPLSYGGIA